MLKANDDINYSVCSLLSNQYSTQVEPAGCHHPLLIIHRRQNQYPFSIKDISTLRLQIQPQQQSPLPVYRQIRQRVVRPLARQYNLIQHITTLALHELC